MIRQFPEVPAAVELVDVAQYVHNHEFTYIDPNHHNNWVWQSPADFDPALKIVVPREKYLFVQRRNLSLWASMILIDGLTEYEAVIPVQQASSMENDPYLEDFVEAYRQYPHGRSSIEIS